MLTREQMTQAIGCEAYGSDGEKIGTVGQVYLDDETQEPAWVTVNTGLFGTKESFVPLANATFTGDRLEVAYPKDTVKNAPNIDDDGHLTPEEEQALFDYYGMSSGWSGETTPAATGAADDAMTLSEERLHIGGTETRPMGRARLRKVVETEYVTQTVPVRRERIIVENVPLDEPGDAGAVEGEVGPEVVLHEERPVVEKTVQPVERVRLGTEQQTEEETVSDQVRRERIEVEGDVEERTEPDTGPRTA